MSTQKRPFNLHNPIRFGQYSPLSITEVYCGTDDLPDSYYRKELLDALKLFKPLGYDCENFFKINITDRILKVEIQPDTWYYKGVDLRQFDFCREVNNILYESFTGFPLDCYNDYRLINEEIIGWNEDDERIINEDKMIEFSCEEETHYILRSGKPKYVSWLIKNVDFFSLSPDELQTLEDSKVMIFNGLYLNKVDEHTYSIKSHYIKRQSKFSDQIKLLNEKKWNAYMKSREQTSEAESYGSWGDSWSSSRNRDFYSDDDEDQIMRGLMNGDGDLFGF